jgi:hypothetical protein
MANLYKGMAGSPITSLSAAITSTQTSITVDNGAVLPDAPNICTIAGDNAQIETVLYTAKSGDVLSSVTRGVEGTAKAWDKGAKVARYFTAYDQDALISGAIVESGSNANGNYIKWGDGTQICFLANANFGSRINTGSGTYADPYRSNTFTWTYPASFKSLPAVGAIAITSLSNIPTAVIGRNINISNALLQEIAMSSIGTDEAVPATVTAIGRWK